MAWWGQGEPLAALIGAPVPPIFGRAQWMPIDWWFAACLAVGAASATCGLMRLYLGDASVDTRAITTLGVMFTVLSGAVFALRLMAVAS